jgi:hypothetical protein
MNGLPRSGPFWRNTICRPAILPVWFGSNGFRQEQLSNFLRDAKLDRDSGPILRRIATDGGGLAALWAKQLLELIGEPLQL